MDSLFYGIDLGISHTVSSYAVNPDGKPETVSLVMGVEDYLILHQQLYQILKRNGFSEEMP